MTIKWMLSGLSYYSHVCCPSISSVLSIYLSFSLPLVVPLFFLLPVLLPCSFSTVNEKSTALVVAVVVVVEFIGFVSHISSNQRVFSDEIISLSIFQWSYLDRKRCHLIGTVLV